MLHNLNITNYNLSLNCEQDPTILAYYDTSVLQKTRIQAINLQVKIVPNIVLLQLLKF